MTTFDTAADLVEHDARNPVSAKYDPYREDTFYSNARHLAAERKRLAQEEES